ncbi:MAG: ATP-dependent DNA helicase, partial [Gammaproteobacteria bacterium]|nr:ATP-dependent DNA helicase [Gammaproteobacteria bacterium]
MTTVTDFFKQGGGLSDTLSHFELRTGQVELVEAIEKTLSERTHLLAEAGTGIGKTFSYLLPTLLQNKRVVISTATKHLQEQIFFKDLPLVEKALNKKVSACLLKGRSNYFCHYRYDMFMGSSFVLNKKQAKKVSQVQDWVDKTTSGDLSEIAVFVDEDYAFKKKITSTTENCLGGECPYFDDCFVQKVREKAKKSDVVVVNHALLMADIVLKETGFAEILPETDVVVIDEAHHLPKIATEAFAEQISARQLMELAKDALQVYRTDAGDVEGFEACVDNLMQAIGDFRDALSDEQRDGQVQLGKLKELTKPYKKFKALMQAFSVFLRGLESLAKRSNDLQKIYERAEITAEKIKEVFSPAPVKNKSQNTDSHTDNPEEQRQEQLQEQTAQSVAILEWNEDYFRAARLPIHLGYRFQNVMEAYADSWLFVSATLSVGQSFDFFIYSLGLPSDIPTLQVNSPFNYEQQSVIHILP